MIDWKAGIDIIKVCCFTGFKSHDKNVIKYTFDISVARMTVGLSRLEWLLGILTTDKA